LYARMAVSAVRYAKRSVPMKLLSSITSMLLSTTATAQTAEYALNHAL
jgi:hypothetical protein